MASTRLLLVAALVTAGCTRENPAFDDDELLEGESGKDGEGGSLGSEGTDTGSTTDSTTETTEGLSDCMSNADCALGNCLAGACVQVGSCKQLAELDGGDALGDGVYQLDPDAEGPSAPFDAFCDMTHEGGGWTLVLKSDGNAMTFAYESPLWGSTTPYQPEFPDLDYTEAKLASYSSLAFDEILVGLEAPIADQDLPTLSWVKLPIAGSSLHALIQPGVHIPTNLGRDAWIGLVSGGTLQPYCNLEGLNVWPSNTMPHYHRVRIGVVANEQADCSSPNSRIGIGGTSADDLNCGTLPNPTGNFVGCNGGNEPSLIGFGAVLVR